ncbi:MAG: hypothetical protein ACFFDE_05460, partial [Promethearchaeota archaeon]
VWERLKQKLGKAEPAPEPLRATWAIIVTHSGALPIEQRRSGWRWVVRYVILKDGFVQDRGRTRFMREPDEETVERSLKTILGNWRQEHGEC